MNPTGLSILQNTIQKTVHTVRWMGTGSRGSRGHGWLKKYRAGLGGRHLQGRYYDRDVTKLVALNDQVFALNQSLDTRKVAYLDIAVGEDMKDTTSSITSTPPPKRITIELAAAALPKTCHNFISLCQEGYVSSKVFRIEKNVGICFGDFVSDDVQKGTQGSCHTSVRNASEPYHPHTFEHEPLVLSHAQKGIVSMLSAGLDKNDSRFIITTVEDAPQLDGRFVAFGKVQQGLKELEQIAASTFTKRGRPTVDIRIVGCGLL
jgi:cyclophilin family peptidyl-prolyl cis-trans isomerase